MYNSELLRSHDPDTDQSWSGICAEGVSITIAEYRLVHRHDRDMDRFRSGIWPVFDWFHVGDDFVGFVANC